tara:strand:+ start:217 stop:708 length:492 start_codon:yes stop_codon:yes gene_type:complete
MRAYSIFTGVSYNPPKFKKIEEYCAQLFKDGHRMIIGASHIPYRDFIDPWMSTGEMERVTVVIPNASYFNKFVGDCVSAGADVASTEGIELPTSERLHPTRSMYLLRDLRMIIESDVICIWPTPKKFGMAETNELGDFRHLPGWSLNLGKTVVRLDRELREDT